MVPTSEPDRNCGHIAFTFTKPRTLAVAAGGIVDRCLERHDILAACAEFPLAAVMTAVVCGIVVVGFRTHTIGNFATQHTPTHTHWLFVLLVHRCVLYAHICILHRYSFWRANESRAYTLALSAHDVIACCVH